MSLNKFTDSVVRKEWMNINAKDIKCETLECDNPPWNQGGGLKLESFQVYNALNVAGINHVYLNAGGLSTINSFAGGVDGQLLTVSAGGFGGQLELKEQFATGTPGEQILLLANSTTTTIPISPLVVGVATCQYVANESRWTVFVHN
jgi:hypothetical protein